MKEETSKPVDGAVDDLPPLPCAELSMPLHGQPSVHLFSADTVRSIQREAYELGLSRAQAAPAQAVSD